MQSFSAIAKNEICQLRSDDCCIIAELAAVTFVCGNISINADGLHMKYNTENMAVAKRIFSTVTRILKLDADVEVKDNRLKKRNTYTVVVKNAGLLLDVLGLPSDFLLEARIPADLFEKDCCKVALLRGAFLGGGSVSNPRKNYHFEFVVNAEPFADQLLATLRHFGIRAKKIRRKQNFVVYLNEGDSIAALLTRIGAHASILNFENVRILKETRNNVNRAVNCETANINKTVNAAMAQIHSIQAIDQSIGIEKLSDSLREAAYLRLDNPQASLQELCEMCGATKSAMNHRFRKLNAIANSLNREDIP